MPIELNRRHLQIVLRIIEEHIPEFEIWVFGSRAAGTTKKFADLDLAIINSEPLPAPRATQLAMAFAESDLPMKVDILEWATTSDEFRQIVAQSKIVLRKPR